MQSCSGKHAGFQDIILMNDRSSLQSHIFMQENAISFRLLEWYRKHKRDLPWRSTTDPYLVWVSEIMLQQTRVDQCIPYYYSFMDAFPDIQALASASVTEVLKAWQGLGYYTRARNMHETARYITGPLGGQFPGNYEGLLNLKGIGRYTAAAIASIAFNEPVPVLDANVYRVLSRLKGISHPVNNHSAYSHYRDEAAAIINKECPGEHNQAIMELGALICISSRPDCIACPLAGSCVANASGLTGQLPVRVKNASVRNRYFHYFIITSERYIYLNHRNQADIWKGLYDFPMEETTVAVDPEKIIQGGLLGKLFGDCPVEVLRISQPVKHRLTHQLITARFYHIRTGKNALLPGDGLVRTDKKSLTRYPMPRLIEKYLAENQS